MLASSSRSNSFSNYVGYAVEGFRDGLKEQSDRVRSQHLDLVWVAHVDAVLDRFPISSARDRQRRLVTALPDFGSGSPDRVVSRRKLTNLTTELASAYAQTGPRTFSRDLNRLQGCGLIVRSTAGWRINIKAIRAFQIP